MKVSSAIAFFSLVASGQATVSLDMILSRSNILTLISLSTGALRSATPAREGRPTSVTITRKRVSAGLISLLVLSQAMAASTSPVSHVAMDLAPALASVA
jgi:hypothetical protein